MSIYCDETDENTDEYIDLESIIPFFTVKKINGNPSFQVKKPQICENDNIKLLINDVLKINVDESFAKVLSLYGVSFRTVMIHGRAFPLRMKQKNNIRTYQIDDGTGTIIVNYSQTNKIKILTAVNQLTSEYYGLKKSKGLVREIKNSSTGVKEQLNLSGDVDLLLKRIKKQSRTPDCFFEHGSKVFAIGVPYKPFNRNDVHFWAYEMEEDQSINRDKEILFKRSLIENYSKKFLSK